MKKKAAAVITAATVALGTLGVADVAQAAPYNCTASNTSPYRATAHCYGTGTFALVIECKTSWSANHATYVQRTGYAPGYVSATCPGGTFITWKQVVR